MEERSAALCVNDTIDSRDEISRDIRHLWRLKNSSHWLMAAGAYIDSRPIDKWKYPVGAYP